MLNKELYKKVENHGRNSFCKVFADWYKENSKGDVK